MIERKDVLSIPYLKKTTFSGSYQGMRFLLKMDKGEEKNTLTATCWEEPYSYDAVGDEEKTSEVFEFSEEGISQAIDWLNEIWRQREAAFREAKDHWDKRVSQDC